MAISPILPRVIAFFRRHPVLLLFAFTPGIPEYLSGSTAVWPVVLAPGGFFLFLALNLGLYGPGVLLVREAHVRWNKGWSTVLLLGGAYGLLEEGTALATLFNPRASVVGGLGTYGHAYGVSWVWLLGVLGVHMVYSVGLPIVLLGLALPATRGRPFLTGYRLSLTVAVYALDISVLAYAVHYSAGALLLVLAAVAAGLLWVVAWRLPAGRLDPPSPGPRRLPRTFFLLGLSYFLLLVAVPGFLGDLHLPAFVAGGVDLALTALLFLVIWQGIGRAANEPQMISLAVGILLPLLVFGLFAQWFLPIVLLLDAVVGLFFLTLWRHYRPVSGPLPVPVGVVPA
ncbi:MAG: hypothetical protein L3K10_01515 [Thermoplasmata archaeon]|nr:hypothetical protein [Thermoplasmata archaeon]